MHTYAVQFQHIAAEFEALAARDFAKPEYASNRLHDLRLQALKLMREALRIGLYSAFRKYLEGHISTLELMEREPSVDEGAILRRGVYRELLADKPDWSDVNGLWLYTAVDFVSTHFPGRIPGDPNVLRANQRGGLYVAHKLAGPPRPEPFPPGTKIDPRIAAMNRAGGYPENTKTIRRDMKRVEDSNDGADWIDRF